MPIISKVSRNYSATDRLFSLVMYLSFELLVTHLLLSALIAGSLYARLPSAFILFIVLFSNTARTALELNSTALSFEASACARSSARRGTGSPTTYGRLTIHAGRKILPSGFLLLPKLRMGR
jgi:hypothetical protein